MQVRGPSKALAILTTNPEYPCTNRTVSCLHVHAQVYAEGNAEAAELAAAHEAAAAAAAAELGSDEAMAAAKGKGLMGVGSSGARAGGEGAGGWLGCGGPCSLPCIFPWFWCAGAVWFCPNMRAQLSGPRYCMSAACLPLHMCNSRCFD